MALGTIKTLEEAVGDLSLGVDADELVRAQRCVDRLSASLALAYGEFDSAELWDLDGATSMTAWLAERCGMGGADAGSALRRARLLGRLPVTAAAAVDGTLSAGQLRAIVANVSKRVVELFAAQEAELIPVLAPLCAKDVATAMREWTELAEASLEDEPDEDEPASTVQLSSHFEGNWRLDGNLSPLDGEILDAALRLADPGPPAEGEAPRPASERRGQSLVDICSFFLERHHHPAGSRHRPHVNVIVEMGDLAEGRGGTCVDGTVIDGPSLASLVCDSVMHRVMVSGSSILDYGTSTSTISPNLFNALVIRDRHCRFPGCDRRASWCDGHHVVHVEHGGPTKPENLCLLCKRHHTRLHRKGWSATLNADAELVVTDPSGRIMVSQAPIRHPRPPPELFDVA